MATDTHRDWEQDFSDAQRRGVADRAAQAGDAGGLGVPDPATDAVELPAPEGLTPKHSADPHLIRKPTQP